MVGKPSNPLAFFGFYARNAWPIEPAFSCFMDLHARSALAPQPSCVFRFWRSICPINRASLLVIFAFYALVDYRRSSWALQPSHVFRFSRSTHVASRTSPLVFCALLCSIDCGASAMSRVFRFWRSIDLAGRAILLVFFALRPGWT